MEQDYSQTSNTSIQKLIRGKDTAGYTANSLNKPQAQKDLTLFTNFQADLDQQSSQLQRMLVDKFTIKPMSKHVITYKYPVRIINNTIHQFYNLSITHRNSNKQGFSLRKLYTKYLGSINTKPAITNQINIQSWHFYQQTSPGSEKDQINNKQTKFTQEQTSETKIDEGSQVFELDIENSSPIKVEKKPSGVQKPQILEKQADIDKEQVDPAQDQNGTDCFVISFYRQWEGKLLAFTNKPQIRYIQANQAQQFKQLKFSIKGYLLQPLLIITIIQKGQFSFEAQLQIIYRNLEKPQKRKHTSSLISKQVNRELNSEKTSQDEKKLTEMDKKVNSSIQTNNYQISFTNQQTTIKKILKDMIEQKKRKGDHQFQSNIQHKYLCFKQYDKQIECQIKEASRNMTDEDICLLQSYIGNCYMTASFNEFQMVWPNFLKQRGIIMFDKNFQTICVALNINGSKYYIKTDYKLPCLQVKEKHNVNEYRLLFSYPSFIPKAVKQHQLVNKHMKQKQKTDYINSIEFKCSKQGHLSEIQDKYIRILSYLYVQKCIALYYGNYQNLKSGNPAEIFMMLGDAITYVFEGQQEYKYLPYFNEWQNNIKQDNKQRQKYLIVLCVRPLQYFQQKQSVEVQYYFEQFFGKNTKAFFKHSFSFAGFQKVGNKLGDKNLIIKIRDYRKKALPFIKDIRQHWLKHSRNKQISNDLKKIHLKSNQFLINLQDLKKLKIKVYVGIISHNYYYSSRQILLEKGKVSHYRLTIEEQTECQVTIHQDHKRQFPINTVNLQQVPLPYNQNVDRQGKSKNEKKQIDKNKTIDEINLQVQSNRRYSKMGIELTLTPRIKLNIFQRHLANIHISWLKCYFLGNNQYDLKIGLKQPIRPDALFQFCTLGLKSKNRLDQIQLASPALIPLDVQYIYCQQVFNYNCEIPKQKVVSIARRDKNNYYTIEHQTSFLGLELTIYQWEYGECFGQNFDIWMHKLDVQKEDYQKINQNEVMTIQTHKVNYVRKNNDNEYSLLIFNEKRFRPGFYKIIVVFKNYLEKPNKAIKQLTMTFTIKEESNMQNLQKYSSIKEL